MKGHFVIAFSLLVFCTACSKNHEVESSSSILAANEVIGQWKIISYTDSGIDKTSELTTLSFQFNSNYTFLQFNNDSTISGSWSIESQFGLDQLSISVSGSQALYQIVAEKWYVKKTNMGILNLTHGISPAVKQISIQRL